MESELVPLLKQLVTAVETIGCRFNSFSITFEQVAAKILDKERHAFSRRQHIDSPEQPSCGIQEPGPTSTEHVRSASVLPGTSTPEQWSVDGKEAIAASHQSHKSDSLREQAHFPTQNDSLGFLGIQTQDQAETVSNSFTFMPIKQEDTSQNFEEDDSELEGDSTAKQATKEEDNLCAVEIHSEDGNSNANGINDAYGSGYGFLHVQNEFNLSSWVAGPAQATASASNAVNESGESFPSVVPKEKKKRRKQKKTHICSVCSKAFRAPSYLRIHFRCHTGERPFKCNLCSKAFTQNSHLKTHMVVHFQHEGFKCNICDAAFSDKSDLMTHLSIH